MSSKQSKEVEGQQSQPQDGVANGDGSQQPIEMSTPQGQLAARLAASISPVIAKDIMSGKVSFAALVVVVDDKFGGTFPFFEMPTQESSEQEKYLLNLKNAKATMLASIEFAKAAAIFKHKAMSTFDGNLFTSALPSS